MHCRNCNNKKVASILDLGKMPLANRLLKMSQLSETEPKYNLEIILCPDCSLVQLKDIIKPEVLFDEYLYFSSNSDSMIQSAATLVDKITLSLPKDARVIEIASNDGYLLQHYLKKNYSVLGIEPAKNIAQHAIQKGIPTRCEYFSTKIAEKLINKNLHADIIHANNVMAHAPDINDFVLGIKKLLKPDGQAIIEVPYLLNLIDQCEFDTIYHEHVFYFSLSSLNSLFSRNKLTLNHAEQIPIHGGSVRLYVSHKSEYTPELYNLLENEKKIGINNLTYYQNFTQRIHHLKDELLNLLYGLKKQGIKIAAYGASAKGSTLLNFYGIGRDLIDFIVDRSPIKQGYYMSGTHIPIYSPDLLLQEKISHTLLLTWNFADEILAQQQSYRDQGGKFIIPIPNLKVV